MITVAFHTLGCKVNQYDSQAMLELLLQAGYVSVPFQSEADVYVINTCTVTGTGDRKSLQLARRIKREHPAAILVLCGCLAQNQGRKLLDASGADLVIGTQARGRIADLLDQVRREGKPICAVTTLAPGLPFESLNITRFEGHTRASVKIQEGCNNHCSYCIIPAVRGPIRSRSLEDLRNEVNRLACCGFSEIVLTGIHLASYGKENPAPSATLLDAVRTVHEVEGVSRIRLGSLEPVIATESFCEALGRLPKVCPQFHLALQSGSDSVLARMRRRYNTSQYLAAVDRIRSVFPHAALTTDILTGFPGETEAEYQETRAFIERIGFARIHVFPYSPRPDTPAAALPDQIPSGTKERRARELISLGSRVSAKYLESWLGQDAQFLAEEIVEGHWEGYTSEYIRVTLPAGVSCKSGQILPVRMKKIVPGGMYAEPVSVSASLS